MDRPKILTGVQFPVFVTKQDAISYAFAFMLGRTVLFETAMPLGLAYLAAFVHCRPKHCCKAFFVAVAAVIGGYSTLQSGAILKYLLAFVLFGLVYTAVSTLTDRRRYCAPGILAAATLALAGVIYAAQSGIVLYDLLMLGAECVTCLFASGVIRGAVSILYAPLEGRRVGREELVGLCVASAGAVMGFARLQIGAICLGNTFSVLFMMLLSVVGGVSAGTTSGVGIGVLCALSSFEMHGIVGIYGIYGFVSGVFGRYRRPGVILGSLLASYFISLYYGGYVAEVISLPELLIAVFLLCLLPNSLLTELKLLVYNSRYGNAVAKKSVDRINRKLDSVARSFSGLAEVFRSALAPQPLNMADVSTLYDLTADKVCRRCGLQSICWHKEFLSTRDALNRLTATLLREKKIRLQDVPNEFASKCIKLPVFVNELNRLYHQYNLGKQTKDHLNAGQNLVATQLEGVSEILDSVARELDENCALAPSFESRIHARLEKEGIRCAEVIVSKSVEGRAVVSVRLRRGVLADETLQEQVRCAVAQVLGRFVRVVGVSSHGRDRYVLRLCEAEAFAVSCFSVSTPRHGETVCGDSVSCGYISNSRYLMLLGDGMGCGPAAAKRSSDAVALLQQFLNAGFGAQSSIRMINSALMLGDAESFTTIDAVTINLHTGELELVKAGANTGYIKGKDFVRRFPSDTLPIGMIQEADAAVISYKAQDGDMIILMSDGVQNANEDWFEQLLSNLHESDPQILAQLLMEEATRQKNGKIEDDMTVIVAKIIKQ